MRSFWRTLDRDIALVCAADALVGASFGAICVAGGLPRWLPIALSILVFAGGAQFAAVAVILGGGGPVAAVLTALVLNLRLIPFGFAVADALPRHRLLGAHLMVDESVAFTLRHKDAARRRAVYLTCGLALFLGWNLSVVVGTMAAGLVSDPDALGLDAAFPAVLLALVLPGLADRPTRTAALTGAALALATTPFLPSGLPVLLAPAALLHPATRRVREAP
jgi:predicted branched-subunit amino acid permease